MIGNGAARGQSRRNFIKGAAVVGTAAFMPLGLLSNRSAYAAVTAPQFEALLPNPLAPGFIFRATGQSRYQIGMAETQQDLGLKDGGQPVLTTVWGYKNNVFADQGTTYPGRTIEAVFRRGSSVRWENDLPNPALPLSDAHLLPVDDTIHLAEPSSGIPVVVHVHGGRNQTDSDGLPEYWFTQGFADTGPRWTKRDYVYPNEFEARTLWYHDHALGITRLNVYAGLAGFYILRDRLDTGRADNPARLPANIPDGASPNGLIAGGYEIPIVIQDRLFDANGQLLLPAQFESEPFADQSPLTWPGGPSVVAEFFGDTILCNGKVWPKLGVEPRLYRLRLLNGSDSRFYGLYFATASGRLAFWVIGTDQGFLDAPVETSEVVLGPGERYDILVDFPADTEVTLRNRGPDEPFDGANFDDSDRPTGRIMRFDVGTTVSDTSNNAIAEVNLRPVERLRETDAVRTRRLLLFEGRDRFGRLQPLLGIVNVPSEATEWPTQQEDPLDGTLLWDDTPTENPGVNDVEIWEIHNTTMDAHPISHPPGAFSNPRPP